MESVGRGWCHREQGQNQGRRARVPPAAGRRGAAEWRRCTLAVIFLVHSSAASLGPSAATEVLCTCLTSIAPRSPAPFVRFVAAAALPTMSGYRSWACCRCALGFFRWATPRQSWGSLKRAILTVVTPQIGNGERASGGSGFRLQPRPPVGARPPPPTPLVLPCLLHLHHWPHPLHCIPG